MVVMSPCRHVASPKESAAGGLGQLHDAGQIHAASVEAWNAPGIRWVWAVWGSWAKKPPAMTKVFVSGGAKPLWSLWLCLKIRISAFKIIQEYSRYSRQVWGRTWRTEQRLWQLWRSNKLASSMERHPCGDGAILGSFLRVKFGATHYCLLSQIHLPPALSCVYSKLIPSQWLLWKSVDLKFIRLFPTSIIFPHDYYSLSIHEPLLMKCFMNDSEQELVQEAREVRSGLRDGRKGSFLFFFPGRDHMFIKSLWNQDDVRIYFLYPFVNISRYI